MTTAKKLTGDAAREFVKDVHSSGELLDLVAAGTIPADIAVERGKEISEENKPKEQVSWNKSGNLFVGSPRLSASGDQLRTLNFGISGKSTDAEKLTALRLMFPKQILDAFKEGDRDHVIVKIVERVHESKELRELGISAAREKAKKREEKRKERKGASAEEKSAAADLDD